MIESQQINNLQSYHVPVLLEEVIAFFAPFAGGTFIDATVGYGGHAFAMLERIAGSRVLGIDADASALAFVAEERKRRGIVKEQLIAAQGNFRQIDVIAGDHGFAPAHAVLFDFGVSSGELGAPERGFSFMREGPLDMRFDQRGKTTALDIVNQWPAHALEKLFREYGEEGRARSIAAAIVAERTKRPIATTTALADVIGQAQGGRRGKLHPATRAFQALRIAVNDELGAIREALPKAFALLSPGGRMATIAFHSLEDRIVKEFAREEARKKKSAVILTKHVIQPRREAVLKNPRARSARLRVMEKI